MRVEGESQNGLIWSRQTISFDKSDQTFVIVAQMAIPLLAGTLLIAARWLHPSSYLRYDLFLLTAVRFKHISCLDNAARSCRTVLLSSQTIVAVSHCDSSLKDAGSYCSCSLNNLWLCLRKWRTVSVLALILYF